MIWIARLVFVILFMIACDSLYALLGLLLSRFSYRRHPCLHSVGLFFLAISAFTYERVLPRRCEKCCGVDPCRCWTCPGQKAYAKKARQDLDV